MIVTFELDPRAMPNGTIMTLGVRYLPGSDPGGDTRGRANPTVYTYVALKTGGLWYLTGSGKVPIAAGWGAVEKWLERDNRHLEFVGISTGTRRIYPVERGRGSEWRDKVRTPEDDALGYPGS